MAKRPHRKGRSPVGEPRRPDRKTMQLCEQVRQALEYTLSGEANDDLLRMLYVAKVEPAPDADRLMVTVVPVTKGDHPDPVAVVTRLHAHAGALRASVASAISRRKVPDLIYNYADTDPLASSEEEEE
jgi:ribosome-binding factor A